MSVFSVPATSLASLIARSDLIVVCQWIRWVRRERSLRALVGASKRLIYLDSGRGSASRPDPKHLVGRSVLTDGVTVALWRADHQSRRGNLILTLCAPARVAVRRTMTPDQSGASLAVVRPPDGMLSTGPVNYTRILQ